MNNMKNLILILRLVSFFLLKVDANSPVYKLTYDTSNASNQMLLERDFCESLRGKEYIMWQLSGNVSYWKEICLRHYMAKLEHSYPNVDNEHVECTDKTLTTLSDENKVIFLDPELKYTSLLNVQVLNCYCSVNVIFSSETEIIIHPFSIMKTDYNIPKDGLVYSKYFHLSPRTDGNYTVDNVCIVFQPVH